MPEFSAETKLIDRVIEEMNAEDGELNCRVAWGSANSDDAKIAESCEHFEGLLDWLDENLHVVLFFINENVVVVHVWKPLAPDIELPTLAELSRDAELLRAIFHCDSAWASLYLAPETTEEGEANVAILGVEAAMPIDGINARTFRAMIEEVDDLVEEASELLRDAGFSIDDETEEG